MKELSWSDVIAIIAIIVSVLSALFSYLNKQKFEKWQIMETWNKELNDRLIKLQYDINSEKKKCESIGQRFVDSAKDVFLKGYILELLKNEKDIRKIENITCCNCKKKINIQILIKKIYKINYFDFWCKIYFQDLKFFYDEKKQLNHTTCFWDFFNCSTRQAKNKKNIKWELPLNYSLIK